MNTSNSVARELSRVNEEYVSEFIYEHEDELRTYFYKHYQPEVQLDEEQMESECQRWIDNMDIQQVHKLKGKLCIGS